MRLLSSAFRLFLKETTDLSGKSTLRRICRERKSRQPRLPAREEAADGGILFQAYGDFVGVAGFFVCACSSQQVSAGGPVGLVFGKALVSGHFFYRVERGAGSLGFSNCQRAVDGDYRRIGERGKGVVEPRDIFPIGD